MLVFLEGENKKFSLVYWQSSEVKIVVKSTLAADCLAELKGAEMVFLIRSVLCDILQLSSENQVLPVFCVTDNRSLFGSVHSTKTLTDKRLKIDSCILREMLYKKEIKDIRWVESRGSSRSVVLTVLNNASAYLNYSNRIQETIINVNKFCVYLILIWIQDFILFHFMYC